MAFVICVIWTSVMTQTAAVPAICSTTSTSSTKRSIMAASNKHSKVIHVWIMTTISHPARINIADDELRSNVGTVHNVERQKCR